MQVHKTILVPGTWALTENPWWRPRSPFWDEALKAGIPLIDELDPFMWSTVLDGVLGKNSQWAVGGTALLWYVLLKLGKPDAPVFVKKPEAISLIAHSHGGQIALIAAAQGLTVDTLITVATPVRDDMISIIQKARPRIRKWVHLHSTSTDIYQALGELGSGNQTLQREMPLADQNVVEPHISHSGLLEPSLWNERRWWSWLKEEIVG